MRKIIILMLVVNTFLSCTERSPEIISKDLPQSIQLIADNVENEYTQNQPLPIFDTNAPSNMILSLQEEMELWINQNNIQIENQVLNFNGIGLYRNPNIQEIFPSRTAWGIGMFAMGRFLTISEKNLLYEAVYYSIPLNIREERSPFRSFEIFKNSLVFNPGVLFNDPQRRFLNSDFQEDYAYLIFYFGYSSSTLMFDIQLEQLEKGNERNFLLLPGSLHYAVFRINNDGNIEFVRHLGIG